MKSTTGAHYPGLDHLRALAALLVVSWHFMHGPNGYPTPFNYVPAIFPLALFDEGHVGVALFMTLSGYIFAKLLDGKRIIFSAFIWNRCLRLLPLLFVLLIVLGLRRLYLGDDFKEYIFNLGKGIILPTLPNGAWSITVEFHFYLLLPLLLWLFRQSTSAPLALIAAAVAFRTFLYFKGFDVEPLSYSTIIGRIDQFAFGMLAFKKSHLVCGRHVLVSAVFIVFCGIYTAFDKAGGLWMPKFPSKAGFWIILPTIEAITFGIIIAWYDNSFKWENSKISRFVEKIGEYSYSIYLLHFSLVFRASKFVDENIMSLANFYVSLSWSIIFFLCMIPLAYISYNFLELPFMKYRKSYTRT